MKSLKYIIKNKKTAILLYIEDLIMFVLLFLSTFTFLTSTTNKNYYSINFTIDYVADILPNAKGLSAFAVLLFFLILIYILIRIFLLSGIFAKLLHQDKNCLKEGSKNFRKFIMLFIIYGIIGIILIGLVSFPFRKVIEDMYNLKTAYILGNVQKLLLYFVLLTVSLFHTAARIKTIKEGKLTLFAKPHKTLPFFAYQIIAGITGVLALIIAYKLAITNTYLGYIFAFILFQIGLFFKITFKLSAFKSIT